MPITNSARTARLRLRDMDSLKAWLEVQVDKYQGEESDRADSADLEIESGNYIDGAQLYGVAAKKKAVLKFAKKILSAIS